MANEALIQGVKEELGRLLKKRPALEVERCRVLAEVEKAQFMTFDLKQYVRDCYNKELAATQTQIGALTARLKELRAPDMDEAVKVYDCTDCGDGIYAGDTFFKVGKDTYCHDCAEKRFERIAEIGEFDGKVAFEQNVNRLAIEMGEGDTDEM